MKNQAMNHVGTLHAASVSGRISRLAALLALAVALLAACNNPTWREITIPEGGFRVAMQGDPHVQKQELDTPIGKVTAYWYSIEGKDAVYGVGYSDYPDAIFKKGTPRQLFAIVRDGWLKRIEGQPQGDGASIVLENRSPGMEVIAAGKLEGEDAYMRGRFYLVGNRLYQVVTFGKKAAMAQSDINQFLSSFKLTPRQETNTVTIEADSDKNPRISK